MNKILNYIENIPIFLQLSWLNGGLHSPVFCVPLLLVSLWVSIVMCCVQTATDYSVLELGGIVDNYLGHPVTQGEYSFRGLI